MNLIVNHEPLLTNHTEDITNDPNAKMQWSHYFQNIITRYQVAIKGWPSTIPFMNLSQASSSFSQLEMLPRKWEMGSTYWKELSLEEYENLRQERDQRLKNGELNEPSHRTRSDKGKKCARNPINSNNSRRSKNYKSAETVNDDEDEDQEETGSGTNPGADTTPAVQGTPAGNAGTASAATAPLPESGSDVSMSTEGDGMIQGSIGAGANPEAGATTPAMAAMANINTLTRNNGTIHRTNARPDGSTTALTANGMVAQGSFDPDLLNDLEQSIFDFDGATVSLF